MKKVTIYQSVTVNYIDGKFVCAYLYIDTDIDGVTVCHHNVNVKNFNEAMTALRAVEKAAGHAAELIDRFDHAGHCHWHYVGKFISHCEIHYSGD